MRSIVTTALALSATATVSAGPLGWAYNVSFMPFGNGEHYMRVGLEQKLPFPDANAPDTYTRFFDVRKYGPLAGAVADDTWQRLYTFGPETPLLSGVVENSTGSWFELSVTLADAAGHTVTVSSPLGGMDVYDFADGETPRYVLNLSGDQQVTLGGRRAKVSLGVGGSPDTGEYMQLRVDAEPIASPEPGTITLAGLAFTGGLGAWVRRKFARNRA